MPKHKYKLLVFTLILTFPLFPQRSGMFNPVKLWGLWHPFAASKIKTINKQCMIVYQQKDIKQKLDSFSSGGKLDAFRHIFFMAAFQQKIKTKKLRKLGIAYENQNYRQFLKGEPNGSWKHDSLSMVMDLHNNEVAFRLFKPSEEVALELLKEKAIQIILNGGALILKRNRNGDVLSCDGGIVNMATIGKAWSVPNCLVKSNYIYAE